MVWHEVALTGNTAHEFEQQITELEPFLAENWKAGVSPKTGNPVYERPVVLVIYREDHKFLLDPIIPKPRRHARRLRSGHRLAALSRARLARVQGQARDRAARARARAGRPADRHPFARPRSRAWRSSRRSGRATIRSLHDRHQILKAVKQELGPAGRDLNFNAYADNRSLFRYDMHTLPTEITGISIGTSTLFAAWNAAIYVAQVEDDRLAEAVADGRYLDATARGAAEARRRCGSSTSPT